MLVDKRRIKKKHEIEFSLFTYVYQLTELGHSLMYNNNKLEFSKKRRGREE